MISDCYINILSYCGDEYSFQNILVCKEFYKIINDLEFHKIIDNNIITRYGISYFNFYHILIHNTKNQCPLSVNICNNYNLKLFNYYINDVKKNKDHNDELPRVHKYLNHRIIHLCYKIEHHHISSSINYKYKLMLVRKMLELIY